MNRVMLSVVLVVLAFSTEAVDAGVEVSEEGLGSYASTSSGVRILVGGGYRFLNNELSADDVSIKQKVNDVFGLVGLGYTLPAHERIHPGVVVGVDFAKSKKTVLLQNGENCGSIENSGVAPYVNLVALFPVRCGFAPLVQLGWRWQQATIEDSVGGKVGKTRNGAPVLGLGVQKQFTKTCAIQGGVDWIFESGKTLDYYGHKITAKAGHGFTAHVCAVLTPRGL